MILRSDTGKIKQTLFCLLKNAIKEKGEGYIKVRSSTQPLSEITGFNQELAAQNIDLLDFQSILVCDIEFPHMSDLEQS